MANELLPKAVRSACFIPLLALLLTLAPCVAVAANTCPWLNEATASGFLGADAIGRYTPGAIDRPATCQFTASITGAVRTLKIVVEPSSSTSRARLHFLARTCKGAREPLEGIGNEAFICETRTLGTAHSELVAGRVRGQVFSIVLATSRKGDGELSGQKLRMHTASAAEQVSGNLF